MTIPNKKINTQFSNIDDTPDFLKEFDFAKLWFVARKSVFWVILLFLLTGLSSFLYLRYTKPLYIASSILKLEVKSSKNLLNLEIGGFEGGLDLNIQGETENEGAGGGGGGVFNSSNLYFNQGATNAGVFLDDSTGETEEYPEDAWFPVTIAFDLDTAPPTWHISINGNTVNDDPQPFATDAILGGLDFYSIDANNELYIDDVIFAEGSLGADDFNAAVFSVYPNPVVNTLNINSADAVQNVTVYDVLGKVVMNVNPGVVSP